MNYKYKCGDETINVWVDSDDIVAFVYDKKTEKSYDRKIHCDEKGKFFTWNKNKVYLDDWEKVSMRYIKERFEKDEWVSSEEICQAIMSEGVENARFIVIDRDYNEVLCKVVERFNRKVRQDYRIVLVPVDENDKREFDYYTGDIRGLIASGIIKIVA